MESPNPYQQDRVSELERPAVTHARSLVLAYVTFGLASLIAVGVFMSQRNFANLFTEFDVELPLVTSIACSSGLPITLLAIAVASLLIGHNLHSIANRVNGVFIVCSMAFLAIYIWGMFRPLMQLFGGLAE